MAGASCSMGNPARAVQAGILILLLTAWCAVSLAAETACPQHFADGTAPDFINQNLAIKAREFCYSGYAVMHSGVTRTPIYAAEYLTKERLLQAKGIKRQNRFHPDDHIPRDERAELKHYAGSGYDRGHLAPAADMPDGQSQYESFSLANMIPQVPDNNRGAWAKLEAWVRKLAETHGQLYIITGPVFGSKQQLLGGAVTVPTSLFKVLYTPDSGASAFIADNRADAEVIQIALQQLEEITGIRFFPHNSSSSVLQDQTWDIIWGGYGATVITHDVFSRGR